MKHLLNDMSQEEMNSIREQHAGGKKITVENFSNMVNKKLGEVPTLISESESELDEQNRLKAALKGIGANRGVRKSERQDRRDARRKEREEKREARRKERDEKNEANDQRSARARVLSYNDDFVKKINDFVRGLERDELVADNFGGYIQKLRDISNLYKRDIKGELQNMDLNQDEE
jgi:alpha-galactosidase/6-phospho-beta-glucosidase family protein